MANQPVVAFILPGGNKVWAGDALPTLTTDGSYPAGDFFWITSTAANVGTLYKCITGSTSSAGPKWQTVAGQGSSIKSVAPAYTVLATDDTLILITSAGAVTLPSPSSALTGKSFTIKCGSAASTSTVIVAAGASVAIDGGLTITLTSSSATAEASVMVKCDGTQYWITACSSLGTVALA